MGIVISLPPDCCEEIQQELIVIKSRIAQLELNDMDKEARLTNVEGGVSEIETLIQSVQDVLCK